MCQATQHKTRESIDTSLCNHKKADKNALRNIDFVFAINSFAKSNNLIGRLINSFEKIKQLDRAFDCWCSYASDVAQRRVSLTTLVDSIRFPTLASDASERRECSVDCFTVQSATCCSEGAVKAVNSSSKDETFNSLNHLYADYALSTARSPGTRRRTRNAQK